ncbi:unnamed protein product [Anisakis simplex]|uniref:BZIP domain-containing protein n=1 Tax=Anisakis simplex TaxID=6269 RepID=A0A0M3JD64_ANISI|nr:unnamed protein product [Anisakis simplex]
MNVGGLATVQPIQQNSSIKQQQTATPEQVKIMTCDGDTMSAASLELRSRFTGSIEKMKIISERAKKRQENARPAIIKREREDQQKYHRRYETFHYCCNIISLIGLSSHSVLTIHINF